MYNWNFQFSKVPEINDIERNIYNACQICKEILYINKTRITH